MVRLQIYFVENSVITRSFRSASSATSTAHMRISEWYLKDFLMPISGLIPGHTPLRPAKFEFFYAFCQ